MKKTMITCLLSTALLIPVIAHAEENKETQNPTSISKVKNVSKAS
ncbi:hypothetical protein AAIE21_14090 [Paenibacillus sp. 102]